MIFRFDDCEVDVLSGEVTRGGRQVPIQSKPFLLLVYLIRNRDRLVEHEELLDELWHGTVVSDAAVRRATKAVRKAIGDDGVKQSTLRTIRGRGYRFVGDVEVIEKPQPTPVSSLPDARIDRFVGREALLDAMDASLAGLSRERGQLLLLSGEGGIGKTRCLEELARRAAEQRIEVHRGACIEGEGTPPFWPWSQILRGLFAAHGRERFQEILGPALADLTDIDPRLLAEGAPLEAAPSIAPDQANFRLADSFTQLLSGLAMDCPMVIAIDDLHWADLASLRLLIHLARELVNAPIALAGTYREFEAGLDPHRLELLGELERVKPGATAALRGLEVDELRTFVSQRYPAEVPAALLRKLAEQSGGNPFFATQLLGLIESEDGQLRLGAFDRRRSAGVLEAVRLQLAKLSKETHEYLCLAAVVGRRFTRGVLVLARKEDGTALSRALSEALRAGLIRQEEKRVESYRFVHALVAEALRQSSDLAWRAEAHARVATALEQLSDSMLEPREAQIAHHFLQAGPSCRTKAVTYTRRAGQRANLRAASDEAVVHFERAVQVLEQTPGSQETLCDVLIELGEARTRANDTVGGRESLRGATEIARRRSL
ncbi:MAG: AAA family ATPase, partial [bacterium]|nr:AAA family ATPase [bacterium]